MGTNTNIFELRVDDRALCTLALGVFEKKARSVATGAAELAIPATEIKLVQSRISLAQGAFSDSVDDFMMLSEPIRIVLGDALSFYCREGERLRKTQMRLGFDDENVDVRIDQAQAIAAKIGEQLILDLGDDDDAPKSGDES